ncbi:MAG: helix-turn-helix transcriptional regulator [Alphaproteobacteria bacterium]|nr:helix-turn-helix transcriptional regulator [Alphaproteobacteria bacterium]MBT5389860.1 helix-turn-helix transcriptional regulator [Alphaproteobacteria bacterium]MBT5540062.1 helix-turn-helix transcriptional regulator [Alphaproteobacteria bacterium]MBT5655097.1 helix-turn-helix transcriptional regulator [Alphaproteobacteria bacterium]
MERNLCLNWQELVKEAVRRRKKQKLTQKELAALAQLSLPTLIAFEQGKTSITVANALKILRWLGPA